MSVFKRGTIWHYRKRVETHGGRRKRIFGTPTKVGLANTRVGAEEAERRHLAKVTRPPESVCRMTLSEFEPVYLDNSDAQNEYSTTKAKRQILRDHLKPHFGTWKLDAIDFAAIEDFKHILLRSKSKGGKGLRRKTSNNVLTVLRRLLVLAKKRGEIASVPDFEWLKNEQAAFRFLDFTESETLIASSEEAWRCMIVVAIKCGLRQSELLALRWSDVDLKGNRLWVRQALVRGRLKPPKSGREREVPFGDDVRNALRSHRHLRGQYVFCDADGNHLTNGECKHPLNRACKAASINRLGWHVLRHTFASLLAMQGTPLHTIQTYMGHASIKTTQRYAHLIPEVAREFVKRLDRSAHPVPTEPRTDVTIEDEQ